MKHWSDDAACAQMDTELFYAIPSDRSAIKQAKRICARCPVIAECADAGKNDQFGIWGGQTPRERNKEFRRHADWVPAIGACRRLRALARIGYTAVHVERELYLHGISLLNRHGLKSIRENVFGRTEAEKAEAVALIYPVLVKRGPCCAAYSRVASNKATREDWPPPGAWHGVDIDDPNAQPNDWRLAA